MDKPHLLVGYGSIAKKHEQALFSLGERTQKYDIKIHDVEPDFKLFKSIIICTPPDEHLQYIARANDAGVPVFCEKPVHTETIEAFPLVVPSLVACNWRFNETYNRERDIRTIEYGYLYPGRYSHLDAIHFVDVLWERYGAPIQASNLVAEDRYALSILFPGNRICTIKGDNLSAHPYHFLNGSEVSRSTEMFKEQMQHWLDVVSRRMGSYNPIGRAIERTNWLLRQNGH